ncbi:MAG: carboxypeptidase-like regulatory domain-containing protein [Dyadobacter fermentans]
MKTTYASSGTPLLLVLTLLFCQHSFAQISLTGRITESITQEPLAGVSIRIQGKVTGTITDTKGEFALTTTSNPPFFHHCKFSWFPNAGDRGDGQHVRPRH